MNRLKLIPLNGGMYHILLHSVQDQSLIMTREAIYLKRGVLRISRWYPSFDPTKHKQIKSQVWIQISNLPFEFRKEQNILIIVGLVGPPLHIDPLTLSLYHGFFARVDLNFIQELSGKILDRMKDNDNVLTSVFLSEFYINNSQNIF